jgi:adenylate kinase
VGGVSSSLSNPRLESHTPTRQPKNTCTTYAIRILETLFSHTLSYYKQGLHTMRKRVILITGTPCVGKTSAARALAAKLDALYIGLTDLAKRENLILEKDEKRDSLIINEKKMKRRISQIIEQTDKKSVVIDGHYGTSVVPHELVTQVFVLRRDPLELRKIMEKCGFSDQKLTENLAAEILDVCLVDALNVRGEAKICELNVTGRTVEETVKEMSEAIDNPSRCCVGIVDWLGKLETEGLLDEYLKI